MKRHKFLLSGFLFALGFLGAVSAANAQDGRIELANQILLDFSDQVVVPINSPQSEGMDADLTGNARVILEFSDVELEDPAPGYFEVYLVTKQASDATGKGRYVGNLDLFGADASSRQGEEVTRAIDVSEKFAGDASGMGFGNFGVAIMFRPVVAGDASGLEVNPRIGSVSIRIASAN